MTARLLLLLLSVRLLIMRFPLIFSCRCCCCTRRCLFCMGVFCLFIYLFCLFVYFFLSFVCFLINPKTTDRLTVVIIIIDNGFVCFVCFVYVHIGFIIYSSCATSTAAAVVLLVFVVVVVSFSSELLVLLMATLLFCSTSLSRPESLPSSPSSLSR